MDRNASEELINQKREFFENIQKIESVFIDCRSNSGQEEKREEFLSNINPKSDDYINTIKNLNNHIRDLGTSWLLSIVRETKSKIMKFLPSFS